MHVTCEVAPHHFTLSDEQLLAPLAYDTNMKMNPPLRHASDREALVEGLRDGTVDVIATDHAPHHADDKKVEFDRASFGIVGLETAVSLSLDRLVHAGVISLARMVELLSTNPGAHPPRIAHEIVERNRGVGDLALVGVRTRGVPIARRLAAILREITGVDVATGALDITLYRDDLMKIAVGPQPIVRRTEIPFSIDGRHIVLVDDVLYTGRTIRSALDALIDFGRPSTIQLVVLVDRGHRELPIKADYVGKNVPTSRRETIHVRLAEIDGTDEVTLDQVEGAPA